MDNKKGWQLTNGEQALKLKQLGFDYPFCCNDVAIDKFGNSIDEDGNKIWYGTNKYYTYKPSVSLALLWLRNDRSIYVDIVLDQTHRVKFCIENIIFWENFNFIKIPYNIDVWGLHQSYEQAEISALDCILEYLLKK